MLFRKESPSELSVLADSFNVVGENQVQLTLPNNQGEARTETYQLPADVQTGQIQTGKIISQAAAWLVNNDYGWSSRSYLGRLRDVHEYPPPQAAAHAPTRYVARSEPRPYISIAPYSDLDPTTPAILPSVYQTSWRSMGAELYGGEPIEVSTPKFATALLMGRGVLDTDTFLYEDETRGPHCYPESEIPTAIRLLASLKSHIQTKGSKIG